MRIRTVPHNASDDELRKFIMFPLIQCKADPLAASHVEKLDELRVAWDGMRATKLALDDKASEAQVRITNGSVALNRSAGRLSKAILSITNDKREDALYVAHFGDNSLSDFKRKSFSERHAAMQGWAMTLTTSKHPTLAALAGDVEKAVAAADAAVAMRLEVKTEKTHFRNDGERKELVDKTNAVCKSVHGELSKLPHEMPGLPPDYADRFFLSYSRGKDEDEDEDEVDPVEAASAKVASLKKDLAAAEDHLKEAEARKKAEAAAAAALEAEKKALAALEAEVAEKAKLAAALKAKLAKSVAG